MSNTQFNLFNLFKGESQNNILYYDTLPKYDLFLSQVVDFLNTHFKAAGYTTSIIQNYIKSEVIAAPTHGKKCGYTKQHLIQLTLVTYMRPILSTAEIKRVFALAFNEINNPHDDILSWDMVYGFFTQILEELSISPTKGIDEDKIHSILKDEGHEGETAERVFTFLSVMALIAQATAIKKAVRQVVGTESE